MKNFLSIFNKKKQNHIPQPGKISFFSRIGKDAFTDWSIIISISSIMAAIFIIIGGYMYVSTQEQLSATGKILPASSAASRFDTKMLKKVIDAFDARADERVMLIKAYKGPSDPLLP